METITFLDFKKTDLRTAKILEASRVEGSAKLLSLRIEVGAETRQIVAGVGEWYAPETLLGKTIIVVANLEPKSFTIRQSESQAVKLESQGMLLAADADGRPVLLTTDRDTPSGSTVR